MKSFLLSIGIALLIVAAAIFGVWAGFNVGLLFHNNNAAEDWGSVEALIGAVIGGVAAPIIAYKLIKLKAKL